MFDISDHSSFPGYEPVYGHLSETVSCSTTESDQISEGEIGNGWVMWQPHHMKVT